MSKFFGDEEDGKDTLAWLEKQAKNFKKPDKDKSKIKELRNKYRKKK